jgi:hypothetical protein
MNIVVDDRFCTPCFWKEPMVYALKAKLLLYIQKAKTEGVKRSQVLHRFQCSASQLDEALKPLIEEGEIIEWTERRKSGRPCAHFFHRDYASELTPFAPLADIPIVNEADPHRSSPCKVCGVAIPTPDLGRPFSYCSPACRRAAREGGQTLADFLTPAADPRVFAEVATLLVMADLIMRGFRIGREMFRAGSHILVLDEKGMCTLTVIPIGQSGTFPDPQEYEAMAAVYRDGRIAYGGRVPLVVETATQNADEVNTESADASNLENENVK